MTTLPPETSSIIIQVLELEDKSRPDWDLIGQLCDSEIARLNETGLEDQVNGLPYQFLEDYDIRRKDSVYGDNQRKKIRQLLDL